MFLFCSLTDRKHYGLGLAIKRNSEALKGIIEVPFRHAGA